MDLLFSENAQLHFTTRVFFLGGEALISGKASGAFYRCVGKIEKICSIIKKIVVKPQNLTYNEE